MKAVKLVEWKGLHNPKFTYLPFKSPQSCGYIRDPQIGDFVRNFLHLSIPAGYDCKKGTSNNKETTMNQTIHTSWSGD